MDAFADKPAISETFVSSSHYSITKIYVDDAIGQD